jgi:hypothetical protein
MADAAKTLVPLFAFMLIPVWIPMLAIVGGALLDILKPRLDHPVVAEQRARQAARAARPVPQPD